MHDLGTAVWLILVIVGVISSIVKNSKRSTSGRAREVARPDPSQTIPAPTPAPVAAPGPAITARRFVELAQAAMPVPPPVSKPVPAPPPKPAPLAAKVEVQAMPREMPAIRGIFGSRQTVVQAIVAAQVLGPPLALQERSIWSPRHNEPSI